MEQHKHSLGVTHVLCLALFDHHQLKETSSCVAAKFLTVFIIKSIKVTIRFIDYPQSIKSGEPCIQSSEIPTLFIYVEVNTRGINAWIQKGILIGSNNCFALKNN